MLLFILLLILFICLNVLIPYLVIIYSKENQNIDDELKEIFKEKFIFSFIYPLIKIIGKLNKNIKFKNYRARIIKKLSLMGNRYKLTSDDFLAIKEFVGVMGLLIAVILNLSMFWKIIIMLIAFFYPDIRINGFIKERKGELKRNLPDALDLLTLLVEAGLDFIQALDYVVKNLSRNAVTEEFNMLLNELKVGTPRKKAIKEMGNRLDESDMKSFSMALVQAELLGAPIGPTLRNLSDQMKIKRYHYIEELGAKAASKLMIPVIIFFMPMCMLIMLSPVFIQFFY